MHDELLTEALGESQRLGMLGDMAIVDVIAHARLFTAAIKAHAPAGELRVADIGSGGGVPGLVVAVDLPAARVVLIDRRAKRTDHLQRLVRRLDLGGRISVITTDLAAPAGDLVSSFDVVTARGFGPPASTLRLGAPLLRLGGILVVSEPPSGEPDRWDPAWLAGSLIRVTAPGEPMAVFRRT